MGSICELNESTGDRDPDLAATLTGDCGGGGVKDIARGLLCVEPAGDATGDEGSTVGGRPKTLRTVSSSDGALCSTSLSRVERNDGASSMTGGDGAIREVPFRSFGWWLGVAEAAFDEPAST